MQSMAAILLLAGSLVPAAPGEVEPKRFEYQQILMGVPVKVLVYAADESLANAAVHAAFDRIRQLNLIFSDYDDDSEISRLCRTSGPGRPIHVSAELAFVLADALQLAHRSEGAFDVTVGPYVNLWRFARSQRKLPDPARLAKARLAVGYPKMLLDPEHHTVKLLAPNMRLDLGGIAKGYAVAQALLTLRRCGIANALISGGGDMAVSGPPPGKAGWRIQLPPLDASNAPPARYVLLSNAGISTSGDLFQRLEINGRRYSHIIDPRTGMALTDHSLVTVIAPDDFTADGLTKVMSVLPPREARKFIAQAPEAAVRIVRQPGARIEVHEFNGFRRYYE